VVQLFNFNQFRIAEKIASKCRSASEIARPNIGVPDADGYVNHGGSVFVSGRGRWEQGNGLVVPGCRGKDIGRHVADGG